jgi:hypothetical protein
MTGNPWDDEVAPFAIEQHDPWDPERAQSLTPPPLEDGGGWDVPPADAARLSRSSTDDLASVIREQRRLIEAVATGTSIATVEDEYAERRQRLKVLCARFGIGEPFPWADLRAYWYEEAQPLGTYQARREALREREERVLDELSKRQAAGLTDWVGDTPPTWARVMTRVEGMKVLYDRSLVLDDFQDVGRRCREIINDAATLVWDESMIPEGEPAPKKGDTKVLCEQIVSSAVAGPSNDKLRALLRAALGFAHDVTHSSSATRVEAYISAQATILVVRSLQQIQAERDGAPPELF